ncbi:bifunctional DNA-binding transcriptional regulator/O6-methylguanine-DNA methyltransferase Ada [Burkholderia plantarii]|uniref:methylated-DNA--[protein]-cysteine S-methyltransferase n=1 Tax=Burkholderia plantarii TaxID=41899 RepID=A0A0B6S441_BURPL|nr:bifunctional DNA-binding transcriptional regulator/O6-methylguanine-DNA methyltransferase Ada [Burkholderia plantarii]AJK48090.1 regulatory protein Ada [Burkholderia plantarii]ALK32273.1 O6-methylguanine-DNA methyltransferase [Burkholderia plantarii]WLE57547.1 bifunctional DNA-binding transcriptional regulator/O6-methylguanine-DNA methyltransferase Ada [Burkholderia plantarii]GLZ17742.1 O6-methylguanine-DNA methyltransferase [Burkholderia plantarii]
MHSSEYSTDAARWAALVARDAEADGAFFYAVRTTGVFCRPSCASRMPRRENVAFFDAPAAAREAGFRPCKRCQPEREPREIEIARRACAVLDASDRATLAELSAAVHVSPFHLQRLFKRVVGVTPRQYQAARRGAALRDALQGGAAVTRAAVDAGYQSSSRVYEAVPRELGMAPSDFRRKGAGLRIEYATAPTPLGHVLVGATARGICQIAFDDAVAPLVDALTAKFENAECVAAPERLAPFLAQIDAYLRGASEQVALPLDISATAFQQRVWEALQKIPYGQTRSYAQIAEAVGSPRAVRAVANACASNPVALAIPCHRVVQKGGALAGYRWGPARKAALLAAEARHAAGEPAALSLDDAA